MVGLTTERRVGVDQVQRQPKRLRPGQILGVRRVADGDVQRAEFFASVSVGPKLNTEVAVYWWRYGGNPVQIQATAKDLGGAVTGPAGLSTADALSKYYGGLCAAGGPVNPGEFYLVGEHGPELFAPRRPGSIVPNAAVGSGEMTMRIVTKDPILQTMFDAADVRIQASDKRKVRLVRQGVAVAV